VATSVTTKPNLGFPKLKDKFIPNLKGKADDDVVREVRRLWTSTFNLRDASMDVLDQTLTKDTLIDRDLVAGKPVLFILRQDNTGGHAVTFQTLKDGSLKFKGLTAVGALDTTANTYVSILFYATSEDEALVVNVNGGGNLN
jgi:hypothetical protein